MPSSLVLLIISMPIQPSSLLKEESEAQVKKLIEKGLVKTLEITPDEVPGFEDAIDENGWVRVIPGVLDGELRSADGFFLARLVKV
jgi:16S rRNA C967 or C1407 C5-methylase (RsmB/RsmF family)